METTNSFGLIVSHIESKAAAPLERGCFRGAAQGVGFARGAGTRPARPEVNFTGGFIRSVQIILYRLGEDLHQCAGWQ